MEVLCINNKNGRDSKRLIIEELSEGSVYSAKECPFFSDCYLIAGISIQYGGFLNISYVKARFIPLSSIDENEFERDYSTPQIQNL